MKNACVYFTAGVLFFLVAGLLGCGTLRGEKPDVVTEKNPNPKAVNSKRPPSSGPGVVEAEQVVPNAVLRGDKPIPANALPPGPAPEDAPPAAAGRAATAEITGPYKIGPGDILTFRSFDDERLGGPLTVRYDGMVSPPMVADVKVDGLSREDATKAIREAYSAIYNDPQISLTVTETRSKFFTVMGDVAHPAEFPYTRTLSLLDAIVTAGGLRVNSSVGQGYVGNEGQLVKAFLIRHADGTRNVTEYDLRNMKKSGPHPSDALLLPDDIVYVPESVDLIYLLGDVARPSAYRISEGMTMLMLLANAGGLEETTARTRHVVLIREINSEQSKVMLVNVKEIIKTGKDIPLNAGDIIYVPRKRLVKIDEFVSHVTGAIGPILGLYTQAYDAYYTRQRFELMFKNQGNATYANTLAVLQSVQNLGTTLNQNPVAK